MIAIALRLPAEAPPPAKAQPAAKASPNAFALALFQQLAKESGNLVVSPIGVYTAASMLYAGARGETERELAATFHFATDQAVHHPETAKLLRALTTPKAPQEITIHLAHALWPDQNLPLVPGYPEAMAKVYLAQVKPLDFGQPADVAATINAWTHQQTRGRIPVLLDASQIEPTTVLFVTTAAYFAGLWEHRFSPHATQMQPFQLPSAEKVNVPMMFQREKLLYAQDARWQAADLGYRGSDYGLIVLLPRDAAALPQLEQTLTIGALRPVLTRLRVQEIELSMPRFELKCDLSLAQPLTQLGLRTVWDGQLADFSGVSSSRLFVTRVIQRATIAVDEKGTVAAAATSFEGGTIEFPPRRCPNSGLTAPSSSSCGTGPLAPSSSWGASPTRAVEGMARWRSARAPRGRHEPAPAPGEGDRAGRVVRDGRRYATLANFLIVPCGSITNFLAAPLSKSW